jgi:hypothetical protein
MDSDSSSDEEDACEPTTKPNAFNVLMAPPAKKAKVEGAVDPIVIAVIYIRWLKWIDPSAPLYGCPYVGQAVRTENTAEEVAAARWKEENQQALREDKRVGLLNELRVHGPEAFDDQIVEWKQGPRSEVQAWANEREIALIDAHGGPLRDPSARCKQTLNLTNGGKGNSFEGRDAYRTVAWLKFQDEMEEYTECYGTALVPCSYVNPVSGYKLGETLNHVRVNGTLWKGHPDEANRIAWLEALPGWAWKARETDEWRDALSERAKKRFESQEARNALSERAKKQFESQEARNALSERAKKQFESQEAREELSQRAKAQWADADEETRAEWRRKMSEALWTPEYKVAASRRGKAQATREAAEGKTSLAERGKATRIENWTKEQHESAKIKRASTVANRTQAQCDAISAKKTATAAAKRAAVLAALPEIERAKKQAEFDRNDLKEANRRGKANALLQLPSYVEKGYQWCYRHQSQAIEDGVVFFQDPSGVWCARVCGDQGAGSSSEHAKLTVGGSAAAATMGAAPAANVVEEQREVSEEATVAGA